MVAPLRTRRLATDRPCPLSLLPTTATLPTSNELIHLASKWPGEEQPRAYCHQPFNLPLQ